MKRLDGWGKRAARSRTCVPALQRPAGSEHGLSSMRTERGDWGKGCRERGGLKRTSHWAPPNGRHRRFAALADAPISPSPPMQTAMKLIAALALALLVAQVSCGLLRMWQGHVRLAGSALCRYPRPNLSPPRAGAGLGHRPWLRSQTHPHLPLQPAPAELPAGERGGSRLRVGVQRSLHSRQAPAQPTHTAPLTPCCFAGGLRPLPHLVPHRAQGECAWARHCQMRRRRAWPQVRPPASRPA